MKGKKTNHKTAAALFQLKLSGAGVKPLGSRKLAVRMPFGKSNVKETQIQSTLGGILLPV